MGLVAHAFVRWRLLGAWWLGHAIGWPLLTFGLAIVVWAVIAASDADLRVPSSLITDGPYRHSRNPMYIGCTFVYVGAAFIVNTAWPLILLPPVLLLMHWTVTREERALERQIGVAYMRYVARTGRYL